MRASLEKRISLCALAAILVFNAVGLWPEISISRLNLNDNVSHFSLIEGMATAVEHGRNPFDFWSTEVLGYPEIRVYQPLAHALVVLVYFALGKTASLMTVFVWVRYLCLVLLPASFYAAALLLDLSPLIAGAAAMIAPLLSTMSLYGLELNSFIWFGWGLFPQCVAAHLWLLSIGFGFRAIRGGRHLIWSGALLGLTALSHLIYGYMAALTLCMIAIMPDPITPRADRLLRTFWIGLASAVLSLFQLIPLLLDRALINHSVTEPAWKWNSYGAGQVLKWLFSGELLDYGRLPVLSVLALAGVCLLVWTIRRRGRVPPNQAFLLYAAALWILLYFGRSFWGPALLLFGVPPDMHVHRVIAGVQTFLVLLAAIGLAGGFREAARRWNMYWAVLAAVIVLLPAILERSHYVHINALAGEQQEAVFAEQEPELAAAIAAIQERGGRTYAGLQTNWGKLFKIGYGQIYYYLLAYHVPAVSYLAHTLALPSDLTIRFDELKPAQYQLFDVRSVLTPAALASSVPSFLKPRLKSGRFLVFDAPGDGMFDVVDAPVAVRLDKTTFFQVNDRWLSSTWPEHKTHLWLDMFGKAPPGSPEVSADAGLPAVSFAPSPPGRVVSEQHNEDIYQAELEVNRPGFMLLKVTWHPNWKVLVDGKPVTTVMLSPGFVGVPVGPGRHRIWCRYEPGNWKIPVGLAGLFCVLLLGLTERFGYLPGAQREALPAAEPVPTMSPEPKPRVKPKAKGRKQRASVK